MEYLSAKTMKLMIENAATAIIGSEPYLTDIDKKIGDGDHGIAMQRGFAAVKQMLLLAESRYMDDLLYQTGVELIKTMGGASGVIFGTMFIGGIQQIPHSESASAVQLSRYFKCGEIEIERRGRSGPGQKTMLDALCPACEAMQKYIQSNCDVLGLFAEAASAAKCGVDTSRYLKPLKGRSRNFDVCAMGIPDPGAVSTSIIFTSFYHSLLGNQEEQ